MENIIRSGKWKKFPEDQSEWRGRMPGSGPEHRNHWKPPALSRVWLFATLSMGLSRLEYWRGLLCPPPGDLPDQGSNLCLLSPALVGSSLPPAPPGKPSQFFFFKSTRESQKWLKAGDASGWDCFPKHLFTWLKNRGELVNQTDAGIPVKNHLYSNIS